MVNPELSNLIKEIRSISIDNRLSDDAVIALMNIHLSIMSMIVANMLEDEYGGVAFHREAVERLFAICRQRSASNQTLARCSRMTPAMYHVFCLPDTVFDDRKHDACLRRSFRLADEWREKIKSARPMDDRARITEYGVLQSILDAFIYVVDEDKEADKDYRYLKHRIAEWALEMNVDGAWCGISDYEAMRRIAIMVGNANADGDNRFDAQIEKALSLYYGRIIGDDRVDGLALFYLYRVLMWELDRHENQMINPITDRAARMVESPSALDRDNKLWYMAILIDRECARINNNIKQKILAYSA